MGKGRGGARMGDSRGRARREYKNTRSKIKARKDAEKERKRLEGKMSNARRAGWRRPDGRILWPDNDGFQDEPHEEILYKGTRIDRYGDNEGRFVAPIKTPFGNRSLAPGTAKKGGRAAFEVRRKIKVNAGKTAPWFDEPGGGTQYKFDEPVKALMKKRILRQLKE